MAKFEDKTSEDQVIEEYQFIKLAHMVADHYKTTLIKSKIGIDNSWIIIQKLSDATYGEACEYGFEGSQVDWVNMIGSFL